MEALRGQPVVDFGTPEEAWQQSTYLSSLAAVSLAGLLANCKRVVVVSPHPDDEVLGCGGLLSLCAAQQTPILIVSVSDGENCYPGNDAWPPSRLKIARKRELNQALAALGIDNPNIASLELPDGQVNAYECHLIGALETQLLETDLVFVPWSRDGHPDHEATARATASAARSIGCRLIEFPIWAWHWASADGGAFSESAVSRLDLGADAHRAKLEAIGCFTSQLETGDPTIPTPVLPGHVLKRFARTYEVFIHE
ncbi:MAG: PIG-L deacetylase family protein [Pseudoxanthomonas sp.]